MRVIKPKLKIQKIIFATQQMINICNTIPVKHRPYFIEYLIRCILFVLTGNKERIAVSYKYLEGITEQRGQKEYLDDFIKALESAGITGISYTEYIPKERCRFIDPLSLEQLEQLGLLSQNKKHFILDGEGELKEVTRHNIGQVRKHLKSLIIKNGGAVNQYFAKRFDLAAWGRRVKKVEADVLALIESKDGLEKERLIQEWANLKLSPVAVLAPAESSDRLFADTPHLGTVSRELRSIILQGEHYFDLVMCHLYIMAQVWDLPYLRGFLASKRNLWNELCVDPSEKKLFKNAMYCACNEGKWRKELKTEAQRDRFLMHPVVEEILRRRAELTQEVIDGTFKIIHPLTRKNMLKKTGNVLTNIKSAISCQLQAYEQIIMNQLFEKAHDYKNMTILSYEHDGFSMSIHKGREGQVQKWIRRQIDTACQTIPSLVEVGLVMKASFGAYDVLEAAQEIEVKPPVVTVHSMTDEEFHAKSAIYKIDMCLQKLGCMPENENEPKNSGQNENKVVSIKTATRRQCMLDEQEQKLEALRNQFKALQKVKVEQPTCKPQECSTEPLTKSESVSDIESLEELHEEYIADSTAKEKLWREYKTLQHQLESFLKQHLALPEKEIMSWALEQNVKKYINIKKENLKEDDVNWMYKAKEFLNKRLPNAA